LIAVDTNILVHAHRHDSEWHPIAKTRVAQLAQAPAPWALPWPCLHEFFAIVTHPRIWTPPTPRKKAIDQIDAWLESPTVELLSEGPEHWSRLRELLERGRIQGPQVHDAKVASLCLAHGVKQLWSADRDFSRFPTLASVNPLTS
jgi:toxin-antitoxin system PIN domain toxin